MAVFRNNRNVFIKVKDALDDLPIDVQIQILKRRMLSECALIEYERHLCPTIPGSTRSRELKN